MRDYGCGRFVLACLTVFLMLQAGAALGQSDDAEWEPITEERLLDPQDGDWMSYRRTYDVTGFSPLDQIDRGNVSDLRLVWSWSMRDNSRWVPTPIVANGLMYVSEGSGRVTAFDVLSGDVAWVYTRSYPEDIQKSQALGRHRGVSVLGDTVYFGAADAVLVALDALTGEQRWEVSTGDYTTGLGHSHPPLVADGKVVLGFAGGDRSGRGTIVAHDAETGEHIWTTYTVPRPGEPGYETWTEREVPPLGGLAWSTISYDPELGLIYMGTGQPTPWASTLRGPGDALYTNCILALNIDTGEIEWYFQVVPADNWDLDATAESMLVDLVIGGVEHKALIETSKIGWGVVLDRETGPLHRRVPHRLRQHHHRLDRHRQPHLQPGPDPHAGRRRLGQDLRGVPAPARRAQPELGELQPRDRPLLRRHQQRLHGRHFRFRGVRSRPCLPGHGQPRQDGAGLRLHRRVRGVQSGHRPARLGATVPESGAPMTASALSTAGGHGLRRHGGPAALRARRRERRPAVGDAPERRHLRRPGHLRGRRPPVPRGRRRRAHRPDHVLRAADRHHAAAGQRRDLGVRVAGVGWRPVVGLEGIDAMKYRVAILRSDEGYSVSVPGLPGCWSQGATEQEALENIRLAIREYLAPRDELFPGYGGSGDQS